MTALSVYTRLIHSDWSSSPQKRWSDAAVREKLSWQVGASSRVGDTEQFLNYLQDSSYSTLAGFDFPIGLPESYGQRTRLANFCSALDAFGSGPWSDFYTVADAADQISIFRPFYPQRSSSIARQAHLIAAHGCDSIDELSQAMREGYGIEAPSLLIVLDPWWQSGRQGSDLGVEGDHRPRTPRWSEALAL